MSEHPKTPQGPASRTPAPDTPESVESGTNAPDSQTPHSSAPATPRLDPDAGPPSSDTAAPAQAADPDLRPPKPAAAPAPAPGEAHETPIAVPGRLTIPGVAKEGWRRIIDLDIRFVRTGVELTRRPGMVIAGYVRGERSRWTNPIQLYLILWAAAIFVVNSRYPDYMDEMREKMTARQGPVPPEFEAATNVITELTKEYQQAVFLLLVIPLAALWRLTFKKPRWNLAESTVFLLFTQSWLAIPSVVATLTVPLLSIWYQILFSCLTAAYVAFATRQTYRVSIVGAAARGVGLVIVLFAAYAAIGVALLFAVLIWNLAIAPKIFA